MWGRQPEALRPWFTRACPPPADDASAASHRVRLLTAQPSVGMVLGKRGATVSQLRQETGAAIKVLPSEAVPPAYGGGLGSDDSEAELGSISSGGGGPLSNSSSGTVAEEVIQVEGSVQQCVAALRGVATLLRGWQIRRLLALQQQHQQQYGGGVGAVAAAAAMQLPLSSMPMSPTGGNSSGLMAPGSPGGWVGWVGVCACVWGGGKGGARARGSRLVAGCC